MKKNYLLNYSKINLTPEVSKKITDNVVPERSLR